MPAEVSSVTSLSPRLTLDYPSFEKLLAAAWVLQCVHDQLHCREGEPEETVAQFPVKKTAEVREFPKPPIPLPLPVTVTQSQPDVLKFQPARDETLAELAEAQQAIETGTLDLGPAMKLVVELALTVAKAQGAAVWLFSEGDFVHRVGAGESSNNEKLRLAILSSLAVAWPGNGNAVRSNQSWQADIEAGASLLVAPIYHGREVAGALTVFANSPGSFSDHHRSTLRLMSGLLSHALRKAAEELRAAQAATVELAPVEQNACLVDPVQTQVTLPSDAVLKKAAADSRPMRPRPSLNLATAFKKIGKVFSSLRPTVHARFAWRALRSAAIAPPVWLLAIVAVLLLLETWRHQPFNSAQATSTRDLSGDNGKKTDNVTLRPSIPPLEVSHMRVTDAETSSVVQELSRYEIRGLRRQAQFGDESAAFTLGMAFETGRYLRQSCAEATQWVARAAEAGNAAAQYNLGLRYRDGDGVPADRSESEKWLRKASAARNPQAQLALKMLAAR